MYLSKIDKISPVFGVLTFKLQCPPLDLCCHNLPYPGYCQFMSGPRILNLCRDEEFNLTSDPIGRVIAFPEPAQCIRAKLCLKYLVYKLH